MKRIIYTVAVLAAMLMGSAAFALPANASTVYYSGGSCHSGHGQYVDCLFSHDLKRPATITIHAGATPRQRVTIYWDEVCSKGLSAASRSGHFTAQTPVTHVISHPYTRPSDCTISAEVSGKGYVHASATYTRWG
jgi:hypothetical protein